ncbi:Structural maintenance of chromosomes protein 3 [Elasticomyces elasticus]|nr:Structural maintenance of chromosomes protein 3 [Elasticomyces elasticus]
MAAYQKELGSGFKKALSNEEERQLEGLEAKLPDLRKEFAGVSRERAEVEGRKSEIEGELSENLSADVGSIVEGATARSQACDEATDTIQTKLNGYETGIEETQQHLQNAETSRTAKGNTIEDLARAICNHQKSIEKGAQKRAALTARIQDVSTQVRNVGVLPEAAFSPAYANLASNVATARLHKVQDALKKYGHVNKKAFEQFAQFERQRETLESRPEELGTSNGSIRELIDHLDQKKDEAIERTFRQVSREFARVSGRLVPAGRGRLIIQRRTEKQARQGAANDSDEEEPESGGVENYTGVGISVSLQQARRVAAHPAVVGRAEVAVCVGASVCDPGFGSGAILPF